MKSHSYPLFTFLFAICTLALSAQRMAFQSVELSWENQVRQITDEKTGETTAVYLYFQDAYYGDEHPQWPQYRLRIPLEGPSSLQVNILRAQTALLSENQKHPLLHLEQLPADWKIYTRTAKARGQWYGYISIVPLRKSAAGYERLQSFELDIKKRPAQVRSAPPYNPPYTSQLADGDIYKIAVTKRGVHKIDYNFLKNELGLAPEQVDPRKIQILGMGGGMLPEANDIERYEDLEPCAIYLKGQEDGSFDPGDYILFYAQAAGVWTYDEEQNFFRFQTNLYDTKNYYFLKIGSEDGLRIPAQTASPGSYVTDSYDDYAHHEEELFNLLNSPGHQGSGRHWFGEYFYIQREYNFSFDLSGRITSDTVFFEAKLAARSSTTSSFKVKHGSSVFSSSSINAVNISSVDNQYAETKVLKGFFFSQVNPLDISVEYPLNASGSNEGWLDYLTLNVRRKLQMNGAQMNFRDKLCRFYPSTSFVLSGAGAGVRVWDVSDPLKPIEYAGSLSANGMSVHVPNNFQIPELVAFDESQDLLQPQAIGKLDNQNLHGISGADMLIIYHKTFLAQAQQLAEFRRDQGLQVELVDVELIFNEFSSGRQDPTAIRDFVRMLYQRDPQFRYLLLFGDSSFDFRDIAGLGSHFVPTYETNNSLHPIYSYPSDDYYALLDENEGGNLFGGLDIAIGRLPVQNAQQAQDVVDKIIHYESSPQALGDWRQRALFIADDEDSGIHMRDCDSIANKVLELFPFLNTDKLYVDAYEQVATSFGQRVPSLEKALNDRIFQGVLTVTYLGHGGWRGWAQERILQTPQITSWENYDKLPLFITATCSFAGFDDPQNTTAGELILFSPRGGGSALFTTVRPVFASQNEKLTRAAMISLYQRPDGLARPLGMILMDAKNNSGSSDSNSRKFLLLGDPAMRLALPTYQVLTTSINGQDINLEADTLSALEQITISGEVHDLNGNLLSDFNGVLYPSVYDKKKTYQTLGQDNTPVRNYTLQKNLLFRGKVSVQNGLFSFSFVAPKDIDYSYGPGKISYYAADEKGKDAGGYFEDFIVGGINPDAVNDDQGPEVEVYMNTEDFVFGGLTGPDPILLVKLQDDLGINVVGNSPGHDLTATLDEDDQNTYLLNDFYEAELDDPTRGSLRYPLQELEAGPHSITIKAWDLANNSAEGYTEFIVADNSEIALKHVLNYPNPFINSTCFQFEHNMEGQEMDVQVDIYTISGRLVKSLRQKIYNQSSRLSNENCLSWDGTDEFGSPLAKGVYLYKVKVSVNGLGLQDLKGESDFEKLVILR